MSSFSDISQETQGLLDTIDSSMRPSSIERLWELISWWCSCGNSLMKAHFLEMVFGKLFQEYERKSSHDTFVETLSHPSMPGTVGHGQDFMLARKLDFYGTFGPLRRKYRQLQQRVQQQRQQLHPQPQLQWLQPHGHQHLPQNLPQQQGESPHPTEELLILACQVVMTLPEDDTLLGYLVDGFMYASLTGVPIEKAACYLYTECLNRVSRALEVMRRPGKFKAAAETLQKIARERSLLDFCVLSTLEAVKGDARKVWSESKFPGPFKELFHVPFLDLYKELQ